MDPQVPRIGDGATILRWTDRQACTIIGISPNKQRILIQEDTAKLINHADSGCSDALKFTPGGFVGHTSGHQRWETSPNPLGQTHTATLRKDGSYVLLHESTRSGTHVKIGIRDHHYDFNF